MKTPWFSASVQDGVIRLSAKCGLTFSILGVSSDLVTSARLNEKVESSTFHPVMGRSALVLVCHYTSLSAQLYPLLIEWEGDRVFINLDKEPFFDCPAQAYGTADGGYIRVMIGKKWYVSSAAHAQAGEYIVPDVSLLCKFLMGEVRAYDVIRAARLAIIAKREQESAKEEVDARSLRTRQQNGAILTAAMYVRAYLQSCWFLGEKGRTALAATTTILDQLR